MALVDYTTFTEVDTVNDRIQKTANHIDFVSSRNAEETYLCKDFGADHFGDFTHKVDAKAVSGSWLGWVWGLSNTVDEIIDCSLYLGLAFYYAIGSNSAITLREYYSSTAYDDATPAGTLDLGVTYYLLIKKTGTSLKCGIYSTANLRNAGDATDGDIDNLALTLHADHKFQYVYGCSSNTLTSAELGTFDIDNLDLGEGGAIELSLTDGLKAGDSPSALMTCGVSVTEGLKGGDSLAQLEAMLALADGLKLGESGLKRFEHYTVGRDGSDAAYGSKWLAQSFTPATSHKIASVKLCLSHIGSPGTVTVSIKATDGSGHPTGADLCSGTTDGDTLGSPFEWREIAFSSLYLLDVSTKYAIVLRALAGDVTNYPYWWCDLSSPTYAGGNWQVSYDGGGSWADLTAEDFMFEELGETYNPVLSTEAFPLLPDGVKVGEALSILIHAYLSLTDGTKLGDTASRLLNVYALLTDGMKLGDAPSLLTLMNLFFTEGVKLGDSIVSAIAFYLALSEGLKGGDSESLTMTAYPTLTDGLKIGEAFAIFSEVDVSTTDGVKLGDLAETIANVYFLSLTEGLKVGDSFLKTILANVTLTDGTKLGDSPIALMLVNKEIIDGVKLGDTTLRELGILLSLTEGIKIGDTKTLSAAMNLTLTDGTKLGDLSLLGALAELLRSWAFTKRYFDVRTKTERYFDTKAEVKPYFRTITFTAEDNMTTEVFYTEGTVAIWAYFEKNGVYSSPNQGVKITIWDPAGTKKVDAQAMSEDATGKYVYYYTVPSDAEKGWWPYSYIGQEGTGDTAKYGKGNGSFDVKG